MRLISSSLLRSWLRMPVVAAVMFLLWLAADLSYIRAGQPAGFARASGIFILGGAFIAFLWASWPRFSSVEGWGRHVCRFLLAVLLLTVWLVLAYLGILSVHGWLGGRF